MRTKQNPLSLFFPKHRSKSIGQIDISYKDANIKQYSSVTYHGCMCLGSMPNRGIYGNAGLHKSYLKTKIFI